MLESYLFDVEEALSRRKRDGDDDGSGQRTLCKPSFGMSNLTHFRRRINAGESEALKLSDFQAKTVCFGAATGECGI